MTRPFLSYYPRDERPPAWAAGSQRRVNLDARSAREFYADSAERLVEPVLDCCAKNLQAVDGEAATFGWKRERNNRAECPQLLT